MNTKIGPREAALREMRERPRKARGMELVKKLQKAVDAGAPFGMSQNLRIAMAAAARAEKPKPKKRKAKKK